MTAGLAERIDQYLSRQSPQSTPPATPAASNPPRTDEGLVTDEAVVTPEQDADAAVLKASLSGAFNESINIYVGNGPDAGAYLAEVPIEHLKACGLRMQESLVPPRVGSRDRGAITVVTGSPEALVNAERRIAKPLGEGWTVKADSFFAHTGARQGVLFRIARG